MAGQVVEELVRLGKAGSSEFAARESSAMPFIFILGGLFSDIDHCQQLLGVGGESECDISGDHGGWCRAECGSCMAAWVQ